MQISSAPTALRNSLTQNQLTIVWSQDQQSCISHTQLRGACPCAKCRAARLTGKIILVDADIKLNAINSMGYGVQLIFSDGHDRGIYPWEYLRELVSYGDSVEYHRK